MRVTATRLRADLYRLLDRVIETGEPLEIERGGRVVRVMLAREDDWTRRLQRRDGVVSGDPDDLAEFGWADAWRPELS